MLGELFRASFRVWGHRFARNGIARGLDGLYVQGLDELQPVLRDEAGKMFEAALAPGQSGAQGAQAPSSSRVGATDETAGLGSIREGLLAVDREVRAASPESLASDLATGKINDFHEVATRINRARISFDFALEIRNKLIDAYRETMRMSV